MPASIPCLLRPLTTLLTAVAVVAVVGCGGSGSKSSETPVTRAGSPLADTPWPKIHANSRNTGQSNVKGASGSVLLHKTFFYNADEPNVAVTETDGSFCIAFENSLYGLRPSGDYRWFTNPRVSSLVVPAVSADGTLWTLSVRGVLMALTSDGVSKGEYPVLPPLITSPAIGADGTIYVGAENDEFYAFHPDGSVKWTYSIGTATSTLPSSPAIGKDGTLYFHRGDFLYAFDPNGTVKWQYRALGSDYFKRDPALGPDDTVYVCAANDSGDAVYAIGADRTLKWRYSLGSRLSAALAVGPDGTLYLSPTGNGLIALNPDGTLKWQYSVACAPSCDPAIDADGVVYAGFTDHYFRALLPNGTVKWQYLWSSGLAFSPSLGANGVVYVGFSDNNLFAFD